MYDVYLGSEVIGTAELLREGMTVCIRCKCRISGEVPYRVMMTLIGQTIDLGLLTAKDGCFSLSYRLPARILEGASPEFRAVPRSVQLNGNFVPISADEPFSYLSRMGNAYLQRRNGVLGVVLSDQPVGESISSRSF